jgi:hypothetical protein
MNQREVDLDALQLALQRKILGAIDAAFELLTREARGERAIGGDMQLRACLTLARLAPALLGEAPDPPKPIRMYGTPDEIQTDLAILAGRAEPWPRCEDSYGDSDEQ